MYISRSNGMLNSDVLVQRDTLINSNTLVGLTRDLYTEVEFWYIEEFWSEAASGNKCRAV